MQRGQKSFFAYKPTIMSKRDLNTFFLIAILSSFCRVKMQPTRPFWLLKWTCKCPPIYQFKKVCLDHLIPCQNREFLSVWKEDTFSFSSSHFFGMMSNILWKQSSDWLMEICQPMRALLLKSVWFGHFLFISKECFTLDIFSPCKHYITFVLKSKHAKWQVN